VALSALDSRDGCLAVPASGIIALPGKFRFVEAHLTLGQFFDFRFGVNARRFFNLPHPLQALRKLRDPGLPSRNLLFPLSARFFTGRPARWSLLNGLQLRLL
jgi:hypothetical protein